VVLRALKQLLLSLLVAGSANALANTASASELGAGRAALKRGDLAQAMLAYKPVTPQHPLWADKLEDLIRYHLDKQEGLEAWRIIQVGRRTGVGKSWGDYERLSVMLAGGCALAIAPENSVQAHLLNAAVYRLQPWILKSQNPGLKQKDSSHLAAGLVPYLADIPETKILRGQGCRAEKLEASATGRGVAKAELDELVDYLAATRDSSADRLLILIRALELASDPKSEAKDDSLAKALRAELPPMAKLPWREFPDPERQWLFVQSFGGKRIEDIAADKRAEAEGFALSALEAADSSPLWLAAIDLEKLPAKKRRQVLARAEKLGTFPGRSWVLYELALSLNQSGETNEALRVVRRILVEGEEDVDDNLKDALVALSARIFAEHRLDARTQGALEAALPARLWSVLIEQSMLQTALAGHSRDYVRLEKIRSSMRHASAQPELEGNLTRALAFRQLDKFRGLLSARSRSAQTGGGMGGDERLRRYAQVLVAQLFDLDDARLKALQPFTRALAESLARGNVVGSESAAAVSDLIQLLNMESERAAGNRSVRGGVVRVGVARFGRADLKPASFSLQPPAQMPRRELMFIPDPATERGWKFSTAKR
jgi:hypothetical protein